VWVCWASDDAEIVHILSLSLDDALPILERAFSIDSRSSNQSSATPSTLPPDDGSRGCPERSTIWFWTYRRMPGTFWARGPCTSRDRKSTRLNSSHVKISNAAFCLRKKIT